MESMKHNYLSSCVHIYTYNTDTGPLSCLPIRSWLDCMLVSNYSCCTAILQLQRAVNWICYHVLSGCSVHLNCYLYVMISSNIIHQITGHKPSILSYSLITHNNRLKTTLICFSCQLNLLQSQNSDKTFLSM